LLPDGVIRRVRLKLSLKDYSNRDLELTIDSLEIDQINRRHFLIGPAATDSVSVEQTLLSDGQISIMIADMAGSSGDQMFMLYRSVMDVVYTPADPTDISDGGPNNPLSFSLKANYPNPFNPTTTIEYSLAEQSNVRVEVVNLVGRVVKTLVDESMSAGEHSVIWNGQTSSGSRAASGVYFYRIVTDEYVASRKMVLLK
ncbi:MAG: T9SS type A sorting domain-containing protein, partial [candidate division Zixibacteria bacterium]